MCRPLLGARRESQSIRNRERLWAERILEAIGAHRRYLDAGERLVAHRAKGRDAYLVAVIAQRYGSFGVEALGGVAALRSRLAERHDQALPVVMREVGREIEGLLRGA